MFELPAVLTSKEASATLEALRTALGTAGAGAFEIDAGRLERFDSSALALLMAARREAEARGRTLQARHLGEPLLGLARLYGVVDLITPPG
jgi:phospholipid transport system transporter-binding protein